MAPTSSSAKASAKLSAEMLTELELSEVSSHSGSEDALLFDKTINTVTGLLNQGSLSSDELKDEMSVCTLTLRRLNRVAKYRAKLCKERALAFRQELDQAHLQLQNLNYELEHVNKEIDKCDSFRSKDEEIELVPLQDFFRLSAKANDESLSDDHELRLARLALEGEQREAMSQRLQQLLKEKSDLETVVGEKKTKLDNLGPQLTDLLEKTLPLQNFLELPLSDDSDQLELSNCLPSPLFVIWSHLRAYATACDRFVTVRIGGDLEAATAFCLREKEESDDDDDDEESDREDEDEEEEVNKMNADEELKRHGSAKSKNTTTNGRKKGLGLAEQQDLLFAKHPLHIECIITHRKHSDCSIDLSLSYLPKLNILTTTTNISLSEDLRNETKGSEALDGKNLLRHLFHSDNGYPTENSMVQCLCSKFNVTNGELKTRFGQGRAFQWLQSLGGLEGNVTKGQANLETEGHGYYHQAKALQPKSLQVEDIVKSIRKRFSSRLSLQEEIDSLIKAKASGLPPKLPTSLLSFFPKHLTSACRIRNWTSVDYSQYMELEVTQHLIRGDYVTPDDFFYRLQVDHEKHSASLIALIAVPASYPRCKPLFCLNLHFKGIQFSLKGSEDIRNLETVVNKEVIKERKDEKNVLLLQVSQLMVSLEVMLDIWSNKGTDLENGAKTKPYLQAHRGKKRSLPLKYHSHLGLYGH